jgi:hypothetical protein
MEYNEILRIIRRTRQGFTHIVSLRFATRCAYW